MRFQSWYRVFAALALLIGANSAFSQQPAAASRAPQGPRVVSPEILADKKVTFRLLAPKAGTVLLNGNWTNGLNIPLTKDEQGIWSVTVGPLGEQLNDARFVTASLDELCRASRTSVWGHRILGVGLAVYFSCGNASQRARSGSLSVTK